MKSSFIWLKIERFKPNATSPSWRREGGRQALCRHGRQIEKDLSVRVRALSRKGVCARPCSLYTFSIGALRGSEFHPCSGSQHVKRSQALK